MPTEVLQVWRPNPVVRVFVLVGFGGLALAIAAGLLFSPSTWIGYPVLLVLVFAVLGSARRRCVLTRTEIIAQGRFVRRVIPLSEVTQVALSLGLNVWVQTRTPRFNGGDICMLRMIPASYAEMSGAPAGDAVQLIREQAQRSGATLQPLPERRVATKSTKPLVFSI